MTWSNIFFDINKQGRVVKNLTALSFKNIDLVLDNLGGSCKFFNTNMIYVYQGESEKASLIDGVAISSWSSTWTIKFISRAL